MKRPPLSQPPSDGVIEMVRTRFADDPLTMMRYVTLAARVDAHLERHGLPNWSALDVSCFVAETAVSPADVLRVSRMLREVLPWLVRSGELTQEGSETMRAELSRLCPQGAGT